MSEICAFGAKTHLPRLLKRVQAGERFVITRHNRPVVESIPFRTHDAGKIRPAINELKAFQKAHDLGGLSVRQMIEEGRRYCDVRARLLGHDGLGLPRRSCSKWERTTWKPSKKQCRTGRTILADHGAGLVACRSADAGRATEGAPRHQ